jgi:hypothetical protein
MRQPTTGSTTTGTGTLPIAPSCRLPRDQAVTVQLSAAS